MQKKNHCLDIRGIIAPITFLQVNQAFREIKPGEILEITGDDSDTRQEIFQVMNMFHYQLIGIEDRKKFFRICLKKERTGEPEKEKADYRLSRV
ncbi:MAG: sulfurtransferase TusA family protein [Desulfococcaceae bacterium]